MLYSHISDGFLDILAIKMAEFLKLEHILKPFVKTRSHDGSAHTFGSSHCFFGSAQKSFFLIMIYWHFFYSGMYNLKLNLTI